MSASPSPPSRPTSNGPPGRIAEIAELFDLHRERYLGAARRVLHDPAEAEDALQDALASACRKVGDFRNESQLSTWLYRIVVNAALMRQRSRRRRGEVSLDAVPERAQTARHDERLERDDLGRAVLRCMHHLKSSHSELLMQRYRDEIPLRVIAGRLGITEGGVKARLHRARAALREAVMSSLGPEMA